MENTNKSYETLFVVNATLSEEAIKSVIEKFTTLIAANGEVTSVNEWGKRRLAYPIDDMNEGYYVLVDFNAPTGFIAELERIFGITEGIMRSIVKRKHV
ncbi:MAG: 30S ribosomal protein S6 [Eubacteriales bacterium]